MEESGQLHILAALTLERTQYPLNGKEGGPQRGPRHFWRRENLSPSAGFNPPTVQPTASNYTVPIIVTIVFLC